MRLNDLVNKKRTRVLCPYCSFDLETLNLKDETLNGCVLEINLKKVMIKVLIIVRHV
jgi:glutaredoxin